MTESAKRRREKGEVVGGGFIVLRRGDETNRFRAKAAKGFLSPFEHPTLEAATAEATRLAAMPNAKGIYCVMQQIAAILANPGADNQGAQDGKTQNSEEGGEKGRSKEVCQEAKSGLT